MPKSLSAPVIHSAIHSALRLNRNIQRAYTNSLQSKVILLPLPSFADKPHPFTINRFFEMDGARFVEEIEALKYLHRRNQMETLKPEELSEYQEYYRVLFFMTTEAEAESNSPITNEGLTTDDIVRLLKIRQWAKDPKFASTTLKWAAGTLVEIGVDYYNQFPEAIHSDAAMGRTLTHLLASLDHIPVNEEEDFKRAISKKIIPRLFLTAVESIRELPKELIRDDKVRQFIGAATGGISKDLYARTGPQLSSDETDELIYWGQVLLHSLIRNAGLYVFSSPHSISDPKRGLEPLIKNTGLALMTLLYPEDEREPELDLKRFFTTQSLEALVRITLTIHSEYPELFLKGDRLPFIIKDLSLVMAQSNADVRDLLPEILRLVLEKTALHLPVVWDLEKEDSQHLLIAAVQYILEALASVQAETFRLSNRQTLHIIDFLLEEVIQRPAWITTKIGRDRLISQLIKITFSALKEVPPEQRSSLSTIIGLLEINRRIIAMDTRVLDKIKWAGIKKDRRILEIAIRMVFDFMFKNASRPTLFKAEMALALLDYLLERLLQPYPDHLGLRLVSFLLAEDSTLQLSRGLKEPLTDQYIDTLLEIITRHPDVVSPNPPIQKIIAGVAQTLEESGLNRPGLLPRVLQLVLIQTADNMDLNLDPDKPDLKNNLLEGLRQILEALSFEPEKNQWKQVLSADHIIEIVLYLLEEISENIDWVDGNQKVYHTLNITLEAFEQIPQHRRPSFSLIKLIIIKIFEAVKNHPGYLDTLTLEGNGGEKKVLQLTLECLFQAIYPNITIKATLSILHQPSVMDAMLDYYLYRTSFHPIEPATIIETANILGMAVRNLDEGHLNSSEELLDQLKKNLIEGS